MVVGKQRLCVLFQSMYDLKATQMDMQQSLIRELRLYKFVLNDNATEAMKNIYFSKGEGAFDHHTKWFKKFYLNCKNLDYKARLDRPIGLVGKVFTIGLGDRGSIPSRVIPRHKKMVLDIPLLNTQHYKVWIKGKVE